MCFFVCSNVIFITHPWVSDILRKVSNVAFITYSYVSDIVHTFMSVTKTTDGVVYGLMARNKKKNKIIRYPVPSSLEEIQNFLYLTIYVKALIPGCTEYTWIIKEAVVQTPSGISNKISITRFICGLA